MVDDLLFNFGRVADLLALFEDDKLVFVHALSGSSSAVERQLPKLDVTGSIPVSRSNNSAA